MNEVTHEVREPTGRGAVQTVHINRLKAYHEREMAMNVICCVDEETLLAPLIDLGVGESLWKALSWGRV